MTRPISKGTLSTVDVWMDVGGSCVDDGSVHISANGDSTYVSLSAIEAFIVHALIAARRARQDAARPPGFVPAKELKRELTARMPLVFDVTRFYRHIYDIRGKLAKAAESEFGIMDGHVWAEQVLEKTKFGYRISIPTEQLSSTFEPAPDKPHPGIGWAVAG